MMENRLRKLKNEEDRLQEQIKIANKHSDFADQVKARREADKNMEENRKWNHQYNENRQRDLNTQRKMNNKLNIDSHKNSIMLANATSREYLKHQKSNIATQKFEAAYKDAQDKQYNALTAYQERKANKQNENYRREQYNLSVANAHQQQAIEHARFKDANE